MSIGFLVIFRIILHCSHIICQRIFLATDKIPVCPVPLYFFQCQCFFPFIYKVVYISNPVFRLSIVHYFKPAVFLLWRVVPNYHVPAIFNHLVSGFQIIFFYPLHWLYNHSFCHVNSSPVSRWYFSFTASTT